MSGGVGNCLTKVGTLAAAAAAANSYKDNTRTLAYVRVSLRVCVCVCVYGVTWRHVAVTAVRQKMPVPSEEEMTEFSEMCHDNSNKE